jgi:hypothetical protein
MQMIYVGAHQAPRASWPPSANATLAILVDLAISGRSPAWGPDQSLQTCVNVAGVDGQTRLATAQEVLAQNNGRQPNQATKRCSNALYGQSSIYAQKLPAERRV